MNLNLFFSYVSNRKNNQGCIMNCAFQGCYSKQEIN
jgi:hypothetical protein